MDQSNGLKAHLLASVGAFRERWRMPQGRVPLTPDEFDLMVKSHPEGVMQKYREFYERWQQLADMRRVEDWADLWEKVRFLIFRTATAIMIAAVVLLTAAAAQHFGIPLPAIRP